MLSGWKASHAGLAGVVCTGATAGPAAGRAGVSVRITRRTRLETERHR